MGCTGAMGCRGNGCNGLQGYGCNGLQGYGCNGLHRCNGLQGYGCNGLQGYGWDCQPADGAFFMVSASRVSLHYDQAGILEFPKRVPGTTDGYPGLAGEE